MLPFFEYRNRTQIYKKYFKFPCKLIKMVYFCETFEHFDKLPLCFTSGYQD